MSSPFDNMSIADIEKLLLLQKEQDRKAEEEKKRKEKEDQDRKDKEWRDRELVEAEAELAKAAKELEEEMEEESDQAGDADATPRVRRDLFRDLEGEEDGEEVTDHEPDVSTGAVVKAFFKVLKAVRQSSEKFHLIPFLVSRVSGTVMSE
jgi:hypothetical protein